MQKIKDFIYFNRKEILITTISIIVFICYIIFNSGNTKENDNAIVKEEILKEEKEDKNDITEEVKVVVDIKGEVIKPGTYEMVLGKRVIDQTTPNMIQRISGIFERNPLISKEI